MKAITKSMKFIGASLVILAFVACGKSSDSGNNVAAIQYGYVNNQCYDITHNTPATYNLCTGVGTTGQFQYINNQCISTTTNTAVDPSYCQQSLYGSQYGTQLGQPGYPGALPYGQAYANYTGSNYYPSTYGGGAYGGVASCSGPYYQYNGFTAQSIFCNGYNCSGMFLYSLQTRVRVYCQ